MRHLILGCTLALLLVPENASAQSWRHRRYNHSYYPSYSYGITIGPYSYTWGNYGYWPHYYTYSYPYTNSYYSYPGTNYSYPSTFTYSTPIYFSNVVPNLNSNGIQQTTYYEPSMNVSAQGNVTDKQARVQVRLQNANDEVIIEGQTMPGTGMIRDFVSPELTPR